MKLAAPLVEPSFGFKLHDEVRLEVVGTVTNFIGDHIEVQLAGATSKGTLMCRPGQLQKAGSELCMRPLLRAFCGYVDIWFLRDTFATDWCGTREEGIERRIESEADMIFRELEMEKWEQSRVPWAVERTFGLYLRHVLSPSVYLYKRRRGLVHAALGGAFSLLVLCTAWGFANLRFGDSDEQATARGVHAFRAVEHAPVTPLVLLLCAHLVMMLFAAKQLEELSKEDSKHLPFPLTYTIIVGKAFMVLRMVMAYSSANLGVSIDYFVWQELILTSTHGVLSLFVGDPSPHAGSGHSYARQLAKSFTVILGIDGFKTLVMLVFRCNFTEGAISYYVNRLPTLPVQLCVSVLIHAMLDLIQTAVTMFTMFIGRAFAKHTARSRCSPELKAVSVEKKESSSVDALFGLLGRWKVSEQESSFEARPWKIQVPDNVSDAGFSFPTVYEHDKSSGMAKPSHYMQVAVPEGSRPGDQISVTEVRWKHPETGLASYDAAALIKDGKRIWLTKDRCLLLERGPKSYVMKGEFGELWTKESPELCKEEGE